MDREKAICLVSGGLDSCVTAAIAAARHERLAFLHVNYGQRTERRELSAFREIAAHYGVRETLILEMPHIRCIGGSALTDPDIPVPENALGEEGIPVTYVPFRNAHLLAAAVSWAEVIGAGVIYIGATEVDSSGYPDCRAEFFRAFERAAEAGTRPETRVRVAAPVLHMGKADVVRRGVELGAPLHLTWSCYQGESEACGACDSCLLRLKGFREAGVPDPIPYREG
ncbi:7-cyano-7-deazaguanine synthase QueC [Dissulfurirhabdus thermomarina]|uniref:7-cyano-7-deazaguanine synthase n=1 Tax=Dissulfurirhabdus thermomarina TaxID=1765737 RepID=A0A6N9TSD2_DISTH|nr:7-cyano-7-deazaguanine synthase QueC [Dissulfurirhabdus thermomarina]NDY41466.1 7-cyano-7-deazaguanine synthase QueC [Dissulfurirhabdus thermomarina]NMX24252.1 7-cyano-7-deazaguanine synthase QueC [Dissulfurirhabdus thermomarina]